MPGNAHAPRFALMAELDLTAYSATAVFRRGASGSVTLPTFTSTSGRFEDPLRFLHGYGSQDGVDLGAQLQALWNVAVMAGTVTVTLTSDDRIRITATEDFTIPAHADNAVWGFSTAGHGLVGGSAPFVRTAPGEWQRGVVENKRLRIVYDSVFTMAAPDYDYHAQSVITLLRTDSMGDADDGVTASLETLDNDEYNNAAREIRWGITDDGYVFTTYPSSVGAITWLDTDFRDRLGFSGSQTPVSSGPLRILTAGNPMPGVLVPTRPMLRGPLLGFRHHGDGVIDRAGRPHGITVGNEKWCDIRFWIGDRQSEVDEHRHFMDHFVEEAPVGYRMALFQHWGDPRRAVEARHGVSYDLLSTPEANGERGRLRCFVSPESVEFAFDHEGDFRKRGLVEMRLHRARD